MMRKKSKAQFERVVCKPRTELEPYKKYPRLNREKGRHRRGRKDLAKVA
jgi:hypothetical protein